MTKKTNQPVAERASNVTQLRSTMAAVEVTLCDDFKQVDGFGFKGLDSTPSGRVVRLGDVVQWLESTKPCPRGEALALVLNALRPDHMPALCELDQAGGYARPVDAAGRFGCPTQDDLSAAWAWGKTGRRTQWRYANAASGGGGVFTVVPEPGSVGGPEVAAEPGLPALLAMVEREWKARPAKPTRRPATEAIADPAKQASRLAILLTVAHDLWCLGQRPQPQEVPAVVDAPESNRITTYAQLREFCNAKRGARWNDDMHVVLAKEKARRKAEPGASQVSKSLAEDLGVAEKTVNDRVREGNAVMKKREQDAQKITVHRAS